MRTLCSLLAVYLLLGWYACKKNESDGPSWNNRISELYAHNSKKITITNGITGTLTRKEGNCMPVVGPDNNTCNEFPIHRSIRFYEYTRQSQTVQDQQGLYITVHTRLVTTVTTDAEGFFQLQLPAGVYSVFIEENGKLYANTLDGHGGVQPISWGGQGIYTLNLKTDYAVY